MASVTVVHEKPVVAVNVAETAAAAATDMTQVPMPLQPPPDQPLKLDPAPGVAVSVTLVPKLNACAQVTPQLIPAGVEVTVPAPVPALLTVTVYWMSVNVAVTD